jgi:hypothetical protein
MRHSILTTAFLVLMLAAVTVGGATDRSAYEEISEHYEAIRQALLNDSLDGVAQHAASVRQRVDELSADFDPAAAGVPAAKEADCQALLPELASAAQAIADAADLDAVRDGYYELSKPLGRYRKMVGDLDSKVAYCPMVKKAWIQPDGEIGNPYMGVEMPDCGQVIAD